MNINLVAPINQLGYGIAALNILEQLADQCEEVALFPIGSVECPDQKRALVKRCLQNAGQYDLEADSIRIFHQNQLAEFPGFGRRFGFPFFELTLLTANERHHMNGVHELFVATEWAKLICEQNDIDVPIHVVNLGVDRSIFHENISPHRLEPDYTIFCNVGKWEHRKGHDVLIEAFNKAFNPGDKVLLKMAANNPFIGNLNESWTRLYKGSKMGSQIVIPSNRFLAQEQLARYMVECDAAVFPARAEGWNLDLLEAMSCGLHCIATLYSGHTEFINENNCRLIRVNELEPAVDQVWFHGDGEWAHLGKEQIDQLVEHLRDIHRLKQTGQLPPRNLAAIETARTFSWQHTAEQLMRGLNDGHDRDRER